MAREQGAPHQELVEAGFALSALATLTVVVAENCVHPNRVEAMSLHEFLAEYGYLAVFAGALLEGEVVLVLAGFVAHQGYLQLPIVMAVAFCGGTLGDQCFYFLGRRWGEALLGRLPARFESKADLVNRLLLRYHAWVIVLIRFMYGLRTIGPIVIGMSDVPPPRFLRFNLLGAAIWAVLVAGIGFLFGHSLHGLVARGGHVEEYGALAVFALIGLVAVVHRFMSRSR
jgi:membrane protein DedA with SNARE-associated domain